MEAEWRLKVITDLISYWIFGKQNWHFGMNWTLSVWRDMMFLASNSLHIPQVKNDYAHVITQDICNKFIEIKFSLGCMVSWWYDNTQSTLNDLNRLKGV